jgi:hypothetical protein
MPGGDRTGPMGMGPMTGRAAGFCAGYSVPGYMNPGPRGAFGGGFWGRGGGRGGGRGRRNWFYATGMPGYTRAAAGMPAWSWPGRGFGATGTPYAPSAQQETDALKRQAEFLEQQLEDVRQRLTELETEQAEK